MKRTFLKSNRLRVLVNGIHAKSGGGVTYLRNIMPLLAVDDELELHLFLHRDQFALFGTIHERVRIHLLDFPAGFFSNLAWEQLVLPIFARVMRVDVTLSLANYGPLAAPSQIIMLRNSLAVVGKETRLLKRLYWVGLTIMTALSLFASRRAIAVSRYARSALSFGLGDQLQNKVSVVYHGVNDVFRPGARHRAGDYLLAVSDIYVQKNLHTLIRALAEVKKEFPDIVLKVAGRPIDAEYMAELETAIIAENLTGSIEFLGACSTEQLLYLYQDCKLFVFPSTVETFGNPLVEAMACGAPIASSNSAAMPEILGNAAVFFDPLDAAEMAERIISLLADDGARERLTRNALMRAERFSWQSTASQTADVIKSVVPDRYRQIGKTAASLQPPAEARQ
jgi:glycosyltransferase involved in cell wall biosynthesis